MTGIAFLRGINVGGRNRLPMADLRDLCATIGWTAARTCIQSGNVVFESRARSLAPAAAKLEDAIEQAFGFRPVVITRTAAELRAAVRANPWADRPAVSGSKLFILFLPKRPPPAAVRAFEALRPDPEELRLVGRDAYLSFPNGVAASSIPLARIEKALTLPGTARNGNTIDRVLALCDAG